MRDTAVPPQGNVILNIYGSLKKEEEGTFEALKQDDELWINFAKSPFYELVKDYIQRLNERLDDLEGAAFESGASSDEIVMRRAVARLTKLNMQSLINKVEPARRSALS